MDKEGLNDQMEEFMKVSTKMIQKKDMEYLIGLMAAFTKDIGKKESNMEEGSTKMQAEILKLENGAKVEELNGLKAVFQEIKFDYYIKTL